MSDSSENTNQFEFPQSNLQKRLLRQLDEPIFSNQAVAHCVEAYERVLRKWMNRFTDDGEDPEELERSGDGPDAGNGEDEEDDPDAELQAAAKASSVATKKAGEAYRAALPPLSGDGNIRDFIACVAQGMVIGVFAPSEVSKLFYGAQVAALAESKRYKYRQVV